MRAPLVVIVLVVALAAGMLLGGCGGAGKPAAQVASASLEQIAQDHLTAVLLVRTWTRILYIFSPPEQASDTTYEYWDPPQNTQAKHAHITYPSGAVDDIYWNQDGSGHATYVKNGQTSTFTWGVPVVVDTPPPTHTQAVTITETYPDGLTLNYVAFTDLTDANIAIQDKQGTMTLPGNRVLQFHYHSANGIFAGTDDYTLQLPNGGASLHVTVPTVYDFDLGAYVPAPQSQLHGVLTPSGIQPGQIQVTGASGVWGAWNYTTADGTKGTFNLGTDMAGGGNFVRDGSVVGVLNWDGNIVGTLSQTGVGSEEVNPAAAARDFEVDRWLAGVSRLSPAPAF
jgi:hypothetical protein